MLRRLPEDEALAPAGPVSVFLSGDPALRGVVRRFWVTRVPQEVAAVRVLPDAATDLVFSGDRIAVAGPDTTACLESLPPGALLLGCQLHPAAVPAVLGAPASACRDQRVDVADLWGSTGRDLAAAMAESADTRAAAAVLERVLVGRMTRQELRPAAAALRDHAQGNPRTTLHWGLGERQTRRLCTATYGYGPRTLRRVLRFQSALVSLRDAALPLAEVAALTGYVDQSHLAHDVREFAGLTPLGLRAALAGTPPW